MQVLGNNIFSALGATLSGAATTMTVTAGHGTRFPAAADPLFFLLTLQDASANIEIIKVTEHTAGSDSLTILRAQEGTAARTWNIGDVVELRLTAGTLAPLGVLEGAANAATIRSKIGAQEELVSGGNLKTLNGESLLGSDDIETGDVTGPAESDDLMIAVFDGETGKVIKDSGKALPASALVGKDDAQTLTQKKIGGALPFDGEFDAGDSGASKTVNFALGQKQTLKLTANTTITLSFPGVGNYQLRLVQDATGGRTAAVAGTPKVVGAPTLPPINSVANGETFVSAFWNGTTAYLAVSRVNA